MATPTSGVTPNYPNPYEASWDDEAQQWIPANLIGLSLDRMIKNGEGNRHAGDSRYYRLILVHGLFATFSILLLTPAALLCARFLIHGPRPRLAMWGHIGFQIASVICLTIAFVCGYFAVGSENWGKNPHHAIGATVYAGMLFQVLFGVAVRWRLQAKIRKWRPLHLMLHQWIGRGVFLLGLAQIPLGLYVYGSPLSLFILYAVLVFLFLLAWFAGEVLMERGYFRHGSSSGSSTHEPIPEMVESRRRSPQPNLGYEPSVNVDYQPLQTPKKSRFSIPSWFSRNNRHASGATGDSGGFRYGDLEAGAPSIDTSRAASGVHSPAVGGLAPPPHHRQEEAPPVPTVPEELKNKNQGYIDEEGVLRPPLHESALRNSTTLGRPPQQPPLQMPEPFIPSPTRPENYYDPVSPISPTSPHTPHFSPHTPQSPNSQGQYNLSPTHPYPDLPSPGGGAQYQLPEPSPAPAIPLPAIPQTHRRAGSHDASPLGAAIGGALAGGALGAAAGAVTGPRQQPVRRPTLHDNQSSYTDITSPSADPDSPHPNPNIAVQLKLNPDKSVSVRRLPPDEAERQRREHARQRQERAREREIQLDQQRREQRRSTSIERRNRELAEQQRMREEVARQHAITRQQELAREQEEARREQMRQYQRQQQQQQQQPPPLSPQQPPRGHARQPSSPTGPVPTIRPLQPQRPVAQHRAPQPQPVLRHENSFEFGREHLDLAESLVSDPGMPGYTPSVGGQSSTIEHASGGLLGRAPPPPIPPMPPLRNDTPETPLAHRAVAGGGGRSGGRTGEGLLGMTPAATRPPIVGGYSSDRGGVRLEPGGGGGGGGIRMVGGNGGGGGRGGDGGGNGGEGEFSRVNSLGSGNGTATAENSEMEQEIVKEQRRKRRREERLRGREKSWSGDETWT